jgi:hypothetical protein
MGIAGLVGLGLSWVGRPLRLRPPNAHHQGQDPKAPGSLPLPRREAVELRVQAEGQAGAAEASLLAPLRLQSAQPPGRGALPQAATRQEGVPRQGHRRGRQQRPHPGEAALAGRIVRRLQIPVTDAERQLAQVVDLALVLGHAAGDALADSGVDYTLRLDDQVGSRDAARELLVGA